MPDMESSRQPGRPVSCFQGREYAGQSMKREEGKSERDSDRLVVPAKAGNAAGGKEATDGTALWGDTTRAQ